MRTRISVIATVLIILSSRVSTAAFGQDVGSKLHTNISAGALGPALRALAQELRFQIVYASQDVAKLKTRGAIGEFTRDEALQRVLYGTGLTYKHLDGSTVTIVSISADSDTPIPADRHHRNAQPDEARTGSSVTGPSPMAQTDPGAADAADASTSGEQKASSVLQTIIVTAEKLRSGESLLETPVPMTVLGTEKLVDAGQKSLQDYYTSVPGLNLTMGGNTAGLALVTIRGITTNLYTNPTVTASIDDVPLGSSTLLGGGELIPDLDPSNLARVEVLRGPQGTLYGGNSMGGLIRYVTAEPSTSGVTGSVQGGISAVYGGNELGYVTRGAANVPVSDTVALRVSGFDRRDPGYVDDIQSGAKGVNSATAQGGMLSALWRPSADLTWSLNALLQRYHADGSPQVNPSLGGLKQQILATTGSDIVKDQVYWLTGTLDLGRTQLKSITSYGSYDYSDRLDYGLIGLDSFSETEFNVSGALAEDHVRTNRVTQELRLYVPIGSNVDWLLGGFYDRESSNNGTMAFSVDPTTLAVAGNWGSVNEPQLYKEYAGFTNVTFRLSPRLDIQLGARESQIRQSEITASNNLWLLFGFPAYAATPTETEHAFTYLVTPRLKVLPNVMAYARFASGFRPGALNGVSPFFSVQSKPDRTQNYEVGLKGDFFDHQLSLDTSFYYISWKDIQIEVFSKNAASFYVTNESAAKSEGVELAADWKPLHGTDISAWVSWDEAVLTRAFPASSAAVGASGDRLPFSARFSGHVSFDKTFAVADEVAGDAGIEGSYIGNRIGDFLSDLTVAPARQVLPGYVQVNLHTGVDYRSWTAELYVNNVTDKRGVLYGGIGSQYPDYFNYIVPRTIGMTIGKTF